MDNRNSESAKQWRTIRTIAAKQARSFKLRSRKRVQWNKGFGYNRFRWVG